MAVVVAGKLVIKPGLRDTFLEKSRSAIMQARKLESCEDFSVSPDFIEPDRVNVFEKWTSRQELEAFRNSGDSEDIFSLVERFSVQEYDL